MEINKEEIWKECIRLLEEIADPKKIELLIIEYIKDLPFKQRHIWIKVFEELLRSKIYNIEMVPIPSSWEARIIDMETLIPDQFVKKCEEVCDTLDEETSFIFKYFWIERLLLSGTIAQLKVQ